jgi:crotonobetainyl-CoA:carnitine CoA-transferase CaiB-like acyl-CoA transferase
MSGFAHITGEADGPPTLPPFGLADGIAGLAGTSAVLTALYHRDAHATSGGKGQVIDPDEGRQPLAQQRPSQHVQNA